MTRIALLSTFSALVIAACGGSSVVNDDAGGDGAITDATADVAKSDAGCVASPTQGAACAPGDQACAPGGCCAGFIWSCNGKTWSKQGVGCPCVTPDAGSFACGPNGLTCNAGTQFCQDQAGGVPIPDSGGMVSHSWTCEPLTGLCQDGPTCACVKAIGACMQTGVSTCQESGREITIHCWGQ